MKQQWWIELQPNLFKIARLTKKIESLEFEFKYNLAVGTPDQISAIESTLGIHYRALMREIKNSNLQSIIETENEYQITLKK